MFLASPISYVLPAIYLLAVALLPKKISLAVSLSVAGVSVIVNAASNGPWSALISVFVSLLLFVLFVFLGLFSKANTVSIPVALVGLPVLAWVAFIPGLIVAAAVASLLLRREAGPGYLSSVAGETLLATGSLGVISGNTVMPSKPDLSHLPLPSVDSEGDGLVARTSRVKVNFILYLGLSIALVGLVAVAVR